MKYYFQDGGENETDPFLAQLFDYAAKRDAPDAADDESTEDPSAPDEPETQDGTSSDDFTALQGRYDALEERMNQMESTFGEYTGNDQFMNFLFNDADDKTPLTFSGGTAVVAGTPSARTASQQSYGAPKATGNFQSFGSPEEGRAALERQLQLYKTGKTRNPVTPNSSLYQAMAVYAPASDNNNPKHYAEFIAKQIGVDPNTPISQIDTAKWADAITKMEGNTKGNNPGNLRPVRQNGGFADAVSFDKYKGTPEAPQPFGNPRDLMETMRKDTPAGSTGVNKVPARIRKKDVPMYKSKKQTDALKNTLMYTESTFAQPEGTQYLDTAGYLAMREMLQKNGSPDIEYNENYTRGRYNPFTNSMKVDSEFGVIGEMAHAQQFKQPAAAFAQGFKDWVRNPYFTSKQYDKKQYNQKGSIENDAHQIIEGKLFKEYRKISDSLDAAHNLKYFSDDYKNGGYAQNGTRQDISQQGYNQDSPYRHAPSLLIDTPTGAITLKDTLKPLIGIDNLGHKKLMKPGGKYQFPGNQVTEIPLQSAESTALGTPRMLSDVTLANLNQDTELDRIMLSHPRNNWITSGNGGRAKAIVNQNGGYAAGTEPTNASHNNKYQQFFADYINSPAYKERMLIQQYDPSSVGAIMAERLKNVRGSRLLPGDRSTAINPGEVDYNPADGEQDEVVSHEYAHKAGASETKYSGNSAISMNPNEVEQFTSRNKSGKRANEHIKNPYEAKADLDALRFLMNDSYIQTPGSQYKQEDLQKAQSNDKIKKSTIYRRLKNRYSDDDLLYLLNNVASNPNLNFSNNA